MNEVDGALVELGRALRDTGYSFTTVTPETHARFLAREPGPARHLRDVFGWSRPFSSDRLPPNLVALGRAAGVFREESGWLRSDVRFSTLGGELFVHSAFPTLDTDAVFFGPDTHRFTAFVARSLSRCDRLVDLGCGSGAGGILAASRARTVVLSDINSRALRYAAVNAKLAGVDAEVVLSDCFDALSGPIDAILANPPYLRDRAARAYRNGGGRFGEGLSVRILRESLARLTPGGTLLLYTGAPIVNGEDRFLREAAPLCRAASADFEYEELDPDVFGEELDDPVYESVERLAAVGLVVKTRA